MATKGMLKTGTTTRAKAKTTSTPKSSLANTSGIAAQLNAIEQQPYNPINYTNVINPHLYSTQELADKYGITYDQKAIEDILMGGVNAKYDTLYQDAGNNERKFYENLSGTQRTLEDTMRAQQAQAVMSGASKGSQAANQLSALLGVSQESMSAITDMAQARSLLSSQKAADQAKAVADALTQSNMAKQQLADLSKALQSNEIQQRAADLSYNANVNTSNEDYAKSLSQAREDLLAGFFNNRSAENVANINGDAMVKAYQDYGLNAANRNASAYSSSSGGSSYSGGNTVVKKNTSSGNNGSLSGSSKTPQAKSTNGASTIINYQNGSPLNLKGYAQAVDTTTYDTLKAQLDALNKAKANANSSTGHISQSNTIKSNTNLDLSRPTMPKITPKKKK